MEIFLQLIETKNLGKVLLIKKQPTNKPDHTNNQEPIQRGSPHPILPPLSKSILPPWPQSTLQQLTPDSCRYKTSPIQKRIRKRICYIRPNIVTQNDKYVMILPKSLYFQTASLILERNPGIIYVNSKQFQRIVQRRIARKKLEAMGRFGNGRHKYLRETHHRRTLNRLRNQKGQFVSKSSGAGILK